MNDVEYRNLHIMGSFVKNELDNKPLPFSDDPIFRKLTFSASNQSKPNNSTTTKMHRKRKFVSVEKNNDDFLSSPKTHCSNTHSIKTFSSKVKQAATEGIDAVSPVGVSFLLPLGQELLHQALELLFHSWNQILYLIVAEFKGAFTMVKYIFIQWRNILLVYCEENGNADRNELFSLMEPVFKCCFSNFSALSSNIKNFIIEALKANMELEVLFILQWSISQFPVSDKSLTVDTNSGLDSLLKELESSEESVQESRFNTLKGRYSKFVLIVQSRQRLFNDPRENIDQSCHLQSLSHPYFSSGNFLNTMDIFRISRGEILCRISDLWRRHSTAWEQLALFRTANNSSCSKTTPLVSMEEEKLQTTLPPTSSTNTATTTSTSTVEERKPCATNPTNPEPTKIVSCKSGFTTCKSNMNYGREQIFEKKMSTMTVSCPHCPPSVKSFQWHHFLEHFHYFHIAGDPVPCNELVSTTLQADPASNNEFITKTIPRDVSTIFVYCRDCAVLCCGKRELWKHRHHCELFIPFKQQFADMPSKFFENENALSEKEIFEIEWYFALLQTYITANPNGSENKEVPSSRQKLAHDLQLLFLELICLCRGGNGDSFNRDCILQLCKQMNLKLPADSIYLRGQVYICAQDLLSLHSSLPGRAPERDIYSGFLDYFQQRQKINNTFGTVEIQSYHADKLSLPKEREYSHVNKLL